MFTRGIEFKIGYISSIRSGEMVTAACSCLCGKPSKGRGICAVVKDIAGTGTPASSIDLLAIHKVAAGRIHIDGFTSAKFMGSDNLRRKARHSRKLEKRA